MTSSRFTESAQRAVLEAQEEARRQGHGAVEPRHLLLGVLSVEGAGREVLEGIGVKAESLRAAGGGAGTGRAPGAEIPFTAEAKRALEEALRAAAELGHSYVGTEHLAVGGVAQCGRDLLPPGHTEPRATREKLVALLRERDSKAAEPASGAQAVGQDLIVLRGVTARVRLGPSGTSAPQEVRLDLELELPLRRPRVSKLEGCSTVLDCPDIGALERLALIAAESTHHPVAEALAEQVALALLEGEPRLATVSVTAHLGPPAGSTAASMSVRLTRRR